VILILVFQLRYEEMESELGLRNETMMILQTEMDEVVLELLRQDLLVQEDHQVL
jgi:hypothetical protein